MLHDVSAASSKFQQRTFLTVSLHLRAAHFARTTLPPNMTIDDLLPPSPLRRMPVVIEDSDDGTASYCSTTSAESDGGGGRAARVAAVVEEVGRLTVVPLPRTRAVSYEDLAGRPRSNPRTRTPRRNPSPLGPSLIRLGAGGGVGSAMRPSVGSALNSSGHRSSRRPAALATARSSKQGPSRRKVRRWDNDSFAGIASEIRSGRAADAFREGVDAAARGGGTGPHAMPNHPLEYRSVFAALCRAGSPLEEEDDERVSDGGGSSAGEGGAGGGKARERRRRDAARLVVARDRFLRGEAAGDVPAEVRAKGGGAADLLPDWRFDQIEPRLQAVVLRALRTSPLAAAIVDAFEDVAVHRRMVPPSVRGDPTNDLWSEVLVRPPVVKGCGGGRGVHVSHFHFEGRRSSGEGKGRTKGGGGMGDRAGFHRLLLHAVCQFHGLSAASGSRDGGRVRVVTVSGSAEGGRGREARLSHHVRSLLGDQIQDKEEERTQERNDTAATPPTVTLK